MTAENCPSAPNAAGSLSVVGIGPGAPESMTRRAHTTLLESDQIVGYSTYVELLSKSVREAVDAIYESPMGDEVPRTQVAVERACEGAAVSLISSGDPNVYALAGLALEILESEAIAPETVSFEVIPGVTAAQFCSARLGAPLVTDTVSISLSDHLTPRERIESRLAAAAAEGFIIVLYNPWSPNRRENFTAACEILLAHRSPDTPVGIVRAAGRSDEHRRITTLDSLPELGDSDILDMTSTIIVGNEQTRVYEDWLITPRGYREKYEY